jgi:hypothetical protein
MSTPTIPDPEYAGKTKRGKDLAGEMRIEEGGAGLVVGLFEPSWLARRRSARASLGWLRISASSDSTVQIEKKLNETLAAGAALLIAIYDYDDADRKAVRHPPRPHSPRSTARTSRTSRRGVADAQAGIAG